MTKTYIKAQFKLQELISSGRDKFRALLKDEEGATTVEYAIVLVAAAAFAGVLILIIKSDAVHQMLENIIKSALGQAEEAVK